MSPTAGTGLLADVVVIGGGPAGEVAAGRCADGGLNTVLVERELDGGECSYRGCTPSTTLLRPGDVLRHAVPAFPTVAEVWLHALEVAGL